MSSKSLFHQCVRVLKTRFSAVWKGLCRFVFVNNPVYDLYKAISTLSLLTFVDGKA